MPNGCFVPGCNSGYTSCKEKRHMFTVKQGNYEQLRKWKRLIRRADRELTFKDFVCDLHFDRKYIRNTYSHIINGKEVKVEMGCWRLTEDAKPTIFPNIPYYLTKKLPSQRTSTKRKSVLPLTDSYNPKVKENSELVRIKQQTEMSDTEKKFVLKGPSFCCAIDCTNSYNKCLGLSFFRFPRDKERCRKWILNSGRVDLLDKTPEFLYSTCRLCELHFEDSEFATSERNKLSGDAVPTRFGLSTLLPRSNDSKTHKPRRPKIRPRKKTVGEDEAPQRQLRKLSENHGKFMENWNPETSNREARKMNRKIYKDNVTVRSLQHYDERGIHVKSKKDLCDCLDEDCPGCHYPCPKCESPKCGHECRNNRKWIYERIEIEGTEIVTKTPLKTV